MTLPPVKNSLRSHFEKLKRKAGIRKGSWKDPFLYLGVSSVVLFTTVSFSAGFILKPVLSDGFFPFSASVSDVFSRSSDQSLFVYQERKMNPAELNIIQQNSLMGISCPTNLSFQVLGSLIGETDSFFSGEGSQNSKEIVEYMVQPGDTISTISKQFGISQETVLWANNLDERAVIRTDKKLIILPVSGILHHVQEGDTLGEIAKKYKGNVADIISFNELSEAGEIYIGDILIIPNGTLPSPTALALPSPQVPLASSYFICPILSPCRLTQGLHWYNAVDFSNGHCGEPILAAAAGQVLKIKYGWNQGAGNTLTILHPNGAVTSYGHLQNILVNQEDNVSQGQIIALMGGQPGTPGAGNSTGCHLHFGVSGAKNPFSQ